MNIQSVVKKIKKNAPRADIKKIRKAYNFAEKKHAGQFRKTGEKYINHPLFVADFLAQFNFNTATYVAALLHDVAEDTETDLNTIKENFGDEVSSLVRGVTKLKGLKGKLITKESLRDYSVENLRKMFLAMAADVRVVLIKLADRLHNMKTLEGLDSKDRKRIAKETIEIYAPLANRLGMGEMKGQLEDYSFPFLYPEEFKNIKKLYAKEIEKRKGYVYEVQKKISKKLKEEKIKVVDIHGRTKHLYSLYKKLQRYDNNINKIYDLIAIRIIVKDVPTCYKVLGILHQNWKPLIGRIKDYIALPKTNGYKSLHTTTLTSDGEIIEVQIRTPKMHEEAEYGIAAHWYYSESEKPKIGSQASSEKFSWIKQLAQWQKDVSEKVSNEKFLESLKIDVFKDRIFTFTPKGNIIDLPEGASPIDFAYHIHTELGNHCRAAIVNYKLTSLDYKLENGDRVEIIKDDKSHPSRDWLNFIKTNLAKNQIKAWFRKLNRSNHIKLGKKFLDQRLMQYNEKAIDSIPKIKINSLLKNFGLQKLDDLFVQISQGEIEARQVIKFLYKEKEFIEPYQKKKYILFGKPVGKLIAKIEGESGFLTNIAKCCNPSINDEIRAHITRSKGASIHKSDCDELNKVKEGRIIKADWEKTPCIGCAKINVETLNRVGMLRDLTDIISDFNINIKDVKSSESTKKDIINILLSIEIKNLDQLFNLINEIKNIPGVLNVSRKKSNQLPYYW